MPLTSGHDNLALDIEDTVKVWPQRRDRWLYIAVADEYTQRIDAIFHRHPRKFRSVHVTASVGEHRWESALFRYEDGTWALPLKTSIRRRHGMDEGMVTRVHLDIPAE